MMVTYTTIAHLLNRLSTSGIGISVFFAATYTRIETNFANSIPMIRTNTPEKILGMYPRTVSSNVVAIVRPNTFTVVMSTPTIIVQYARQPMRLLGFCVMPPVYNTLETPVLADILSTPIVLRNDTNNLVIDFATR